MCSTILATGDCSLRRSVLRIKCGALNSKLATLFPLRLPCHMPWHQPIRERVHTLLHNDSIPLPSASFPILSPLSTNYVGDMVFEIDPTTHAWPRCYHKCDLCRICPDDHALKALFINASHLVGRPLPERGVRLVSGVVTMWKTSPPLPSYCSTVAPPLCSACTAAPSWILDAPNPWFTKMFLTKQSLQALPAVLAYAPPHHVHGMASIPPNSSEPTNRPVWQF